MVLLIFFFICTVSLSVSGYYQTELREKTILTEEAIAAFEKDLESGKEIDIDNYLSKQQKDYDNMFSTSGRYISNKVNSTISTGIKEILKIIIKAIDD